MRRSGWFLIASLLAAALVVMPRPAEAAAGDGSVFVGRWIGASQLSATPQSPLLPPNPCKLELLSAKNRRLQGTLEIIPCVFPVDLTVSASGNVNGGGTESDGDRVQVHGQVAAFGDGSVRLLALDFKIFEADGSVRPGSAAIVQLLPAVQSGGPHVAGQWEGTWLSSDRPGGGCLEASFRTGGGRDQAPTSEIFGSVVFEDFPVWPFMPDPNFDVIGTAGSPGRQGGPTNFILIGLMPSPDGSGNSIIAILIGLSTPPDPVKPPSLQGDYLMFSSLQDLTRNVTTGKGSPLDKGTFNLPAVQ